MIVLAINSGSSSLKIGLYRVGDGEPAPLFSGPLASIDALRAALADKAVPAPQAIGHRIVHGGPGLRRHLRIDAAVLQQIEAATPFAPLHTPVAVAAIRHCAELFPGLPQMACFDTAFHAGLHDAARVLPLPKAWQSRGIQRYGFHGLSCESIVHHLTRTLPQGLPERVLIAHLGNGASISAVQAGRSIDTSMGLTPSGGLIMGTRCGDIDPGLLLHLLREQGSDTERLATLLDRESGLLGISGLSSDMRRLHQAADGDTEHAADARLAIRMFCIAVAKQLAAMMTVLGGADLIVFSGGIGEHDAAVRAAVCERLAWFGIQLDDARNRAEAGGIDRSISSPASRCAVQVVGSREDEQIARHVQRLMA
ncbi:acetate/propionate family kinase [Aquabacterium sp.]|uniref:acetate/propionate family kinase n=1 Tax=Aquabacterium sp. TaxID=1872578 RepID=UPI002C934E3B|nr:acetate/propionate family kinase [Aquabacterium sp.]HSW04032.1 acetate/propionate family kinase [Aquabacterium sp.]